MERRPLCIGARMVFISTSQFQSRLRTIYPREMYDLQLSSVACAHCSTPLSGSTLAPSCQGSTSSPPCSARFCNRLCLSRAGKTHPLLCRSRNPAAIPLLDFARQNQWMALHALSQCTAKILLSFQQDESTFDSDWTVFRSFAQLGMEERAKGGWYVHAS